MRRIFSEQTIPVWLLLATVIALAFLTGCSPPTICDLYPGGNSHSGERCLNCHKHWSGKWYKNGEPVDAEICPYSN